jgi:hypothetical protein
MAVIVSLIIISSLVALLGRNRKIGYGWAFAICLLASPIIGLIIILLSKKNDTVFIDTSKE